MGKVHYKSGYKYQLDKNYQIKTNIIGYEIKFDFIRFNKDGLLTILRGYAWDGPSGPTVDTNNSIRGSLVHDAIYQLISNKKLPLRYRVDADKLFLCILREDGMSSFRSWLWFKAVFAFGKSFAKNKKKIKIAP